MIVVVGNPLLRAPELGGGAGGAAAMAAASAARDGATVQLVGKVGDDPRGDEVLLAMAAAGIGHVAVLRDAAHRTPLVALRAAESAGLLDDGIEDVVIEPADAAERPSLDAADVQLALRYLPDYRVLVVAEPQPDDILAVVADAAAYANASMLVAVADGSRASAPAGALVIESAMDVPAVQSTVGDVLGAIAARIDAGVEPNDALRDVVAAKGLTPAG